MEHLAKLVRFALALFLFLAFNYYKTAVEGQSITQPQCSGDPDDPNDFVETANPYSNDQDGCACHSNSTTLGPYCYCLVGYGELVSTFNCTRTCYTAGSGCKKPDGTTDCVATTYAAAVVEGCLCGPGFIRSITGGACTAISGLADGQCDPSRDLGVGDERTCVCEDLYGFPGTAYLDMNTCFCKSGWTSDPADLGVCVQHCNEIWPGGHCYMNDTVTVCNATGVTDKTCRCGPGFTPRVNDTAVSPFIPCEATYCIIGEGPTANHPFCVREIFNASSAGIALYDPYYTICASGTGSQFNQSYCGRDCMAGDHYCMNSDFTGPCTTGDMDCRCKAGFGLKALTTATSKCVPVRCTLEDPNCYCNNTFDPIDECFCGYWTTPDQNNPGFCTSSCPLGEANCVRGDTKERCYSDYVGSAGCQCRNEPNMELWIPYSTNYSTSLAPGIPSTTTVLMWDAATSCMNGVGDKCMRGMPNCNCTVPNGIPTDTMSECICDSWNNYIADPANPGGCILANKTCSLGSFPNTTEICNEFACHNNETQSFNLNCFNTSDILTSTHPDLTILCAGNTAGLNNDWCVCGYGYYPDSTGNCTFHGNDTAGYCDKRWPNCECANANVSSCTCALGYYADHSLNTSFTCNRDCGVNVENCVQVANTSLNCTTAWTSANLGTCRCNDGYKPVYDGTSVTCIRVNCDFDFDANCNKGVFISQNDYTNVHCAEGFVPDNLPGNIGHCTAGCTINTTVQSVDHHCREGGTVNSPGSSNCTSPPCFCELGYNPQFVDFTSDITCVQAPCNPLVDTTGKCKCQYVLGAVSHDMTNCKCEPPYTSSSNNDGTCALECTAGEDHCKIASNNVTACTGTGCECRKGYYSIWDTVTGKYRCEPYECDNTVEGCVCTHPGDVDTCSCSGTISVGTTTPVSISFVGNKYLFPGYCRPVECSPGSDPNCECIDSSLLDTCYCKPGYSTDLKFAEIRADNTSGLEVNSYFNTLCKPIDFRASCPLRAWVEEIPDHTTGCSCTWLDQHGSNPEKLCKCGIVVDDDCFFTACDSSLDVYSKQSDGPCSYEATTVESVINNYAICKDGLVSDLNGGCVRECNWMMNSPNSCTETTEKCATGFIAHYDLNLNKNCYLVECLPTDSNCQCPTAVTNLHGYDDRLCRCAPGYAPDGTGACTQLCDQTQEHCTRTCTGGNCCAYGYTPRTSWTYDTTGSNVYTATVQCVQAACNQALGSTSCVCQEGANDEGLDSAQCACATGLLHDGQGNCVSPTVATCVTCSGIGDASSCFSRVLLASEVSTTAVSVASFGLETCTLDTNTLQQNYQSCELRYVVTDNDLNSAPVTRGCSSNVCSDQAAGVLVCDVNGNVQTCTICCSSGANCNTFSGIVAAGKDQVMPNIVALMVPLVMMLVMAMKEHN